MASSINKHPDGEIDFWEKCCGYKFSLPLSPFSNGLTMAPLKRNHRQVVQVGAKKWPICNVDTSLAKILGLEREEGEKRLFDECVEKRLAINLESMLLPLAAKRVRS